MSPADWRARMLWVHLLVLIVLVGAYINADFGVTSSSTG